MSIKTKEQIMSVNYYNFPIRNTEERQNIIAKLKSNYFSKKQNSDRSYDVKEL